MKLLKMPLIWLQTKLQAEPEEVEIPTTFAEVVVRADALIDDMLTIGILLEQTKDWEKLEPYSKELRLLEAQKYYKEALYKLESLHDEISIAHQEVMNHDAYHSFEAKRNAKAQSRKDASGGSIH